MAEDPVMPMLPPFHDIEVTKMKFDPAMYKSVLYLVDFDLCGNTPSFRKSGVQLFHQVIKITPSNFPQISFLNLEGQWYALRVPFWRFQPWHWSLEVALIQRQTERRCSEEIFQIFESRIMSKMKRRQWMTVYMRKYLKYCQITRRCYNEYEAHKINAKLTTILLLYWNGKDTNLIADFLRTVYVTQTLKNIFFFEENKCTDIMHYLIYQSRKSRYDMWGFLSDNPVFNEFPNCPILGCFLLGYDVRMEILLKYGFQRLATASVINHYLSGQQNPLYEMHGVTEKLSQIGLHIRLPNPHWNIYILQRSFLVIEMLYILCQINSDFRIQNWMRCCNLLWRSIPDPRLSLEEIKNTLHFLVVADSRKNINNLCQKYGETFYEVSDLTTAPRSLKHLCRCIIRQRLRQNCALPQGILCLFLPRNLQAFLRLEW